MVSINVGNCCEFLKRRFFLISWISIIAYIFYDTFMFYKIKQQYYYLRCILGVGLCISRSTATVLNICCALVLLPLCRKLNQILYRVLSKVWPGLFFFWLERTKSFHMTVAITLYVFAVIHSLSHFCNLWNFSRNYDEVRTDLNLASYKNENPFLLLLSQPGLTGLSMLFITTGMSITSLRIVRRRVYNAFWYTHQLYLPFMFLLIIHPLRGVLKEEVIEERENISSQIVKWNNSTNNTPRFVAIKSKTWLWMAFPLSCFFIDLIWRTFTRNRAAVDILQVTTLPSRVISLKMSCPYEAFTCRPGQYVLLQCVDISLLEWHPFTVVKVPTAKEKDFVIWIKVKGDWTEALETLLTEKDCGKLRMLVDGPMASPMERVARTSVALCVAAGVGVTPFVPVLQHLLSEPRSAYPGRVHLVWVVRREREAAMLADLATRCLQRLRTANRPDRLHLQIYVTSTPANQNYTASTMVNEKGVTCVLKDMTEEKITLLTPHIKRKINVDDDNELDSLAKYPIVACRVSRGRPYWDQVFGYWVHLYPGENLSVFCCGPKKLVETLKSKCIEVTQSTHTKFTFVHERYLIICKMALTMSRRVFDPEEMFEFNIKYLTYVGLWPKEHWTQAQKYLYKSYEVSLHLLFIIHVIVVGIGSYQHKHDTSVFLANLDKSVISYNFGLRLVLFMWKRDRLRMLISDVGYSGDKISDESKKLMTTHVVFITVLGTSLVAIFSAFAMYKFEMNVEAWMPFDPLQSRMHLLLAANILAVQFLIPSLYRSFAMQGIVCSLMIYSKSMDDMFKEYFVVQNLAITVELCLNAMMMTVVGFEEKVLLVSFLAFLAATLLNMYFYCYLGNEIIIKSEGIALAAYETSWTLWPVDMQKDLLMVIRAAQKPMQLTAGGIIPMSMQTFGQALYNGYSVFAVLYDVVD